MILSHKMIGVENDFILPLYSIVIDDFGNKAAISVVEWERDPTWLEYLVSKDTMVHVYRPRGE